MKASDELRVRISRRGDALPAIPFGGASIASIVSAIALAQAMMPYVFPILLGALIATYAAIRTAEAFEHGGASAPLSTMAAAAYFLLATGYVMTVFDGCFGDGFGPWIDAPRGLVGGFEGLKFVGMLAVPVHVWKWLRPRLVRNVGACKRRVVVYV